MDEWNLYRIEFGLELNSIKREIVAFKPLKHYNIELEYEIGLTNFLQKTCKVEPQKRIGKVTIDGLINGRFGLEIKNKLNRNELNRLVGQALTYNEVLPFVFIVLFNTRKEMVIELRNRLDSHIKKFLIISKVEAD